MREISCEQKELQEVSVVFVQGGLRFGTDRRKDPSTEEMGFYSIWPTISIIPAMALDSGSTTGTLMNLISSFPELTD